MAIAFCGAGRSAKRVAVSGGLSGKNRVGKSCPVMIDANFLRLSSFTG
jgi:hypothetical protein